jgi:hypothetical protein
LLNEISLYNGILTAITKDLIVLRECLSGRGLMEVEQEKLIEDMMNNRVPEQWRG